MDRFQELLLKLNRRPPRLVPVTTAPEIFTEVPDYLVVMATILLFAVALYLCVRYGIPWTAEDLVDDPFPAVPRENIQNPAYEARPSVIAARAAIARVLNRNIQQETPAIANAEGDSKRDSTKNDSDGREGHVGQAHTPASPKIPKKKAPGVGKNVGSVRYETKGSALRSTLSAAARAERENIERIARIMANAENSQAITGKASVCVKSEKSTKKRSQPPVKVPVAATASTVIRPDTPTIGNIEANKDEAAANKEVDLDPASSTGAMTESNNALGLGRGGCVGQTPSPASPNSPKKRPRGRCTHIYTGDKRYDTKGSKQRAAINAAARAERENKERIARMSESDETNSQAITGKASVCIKSTSKDDKIMKILSQPPVTVPVAATASTVIRPDTPTIANIEANKDEAAANKEVDLDPASSTGAMTESNNALGLGHGGCVGQTPSPASPNSPKKKPRGRCTHIYTGDKRYDTKGSKQRAAINAAARAERENKERIARMSKSEETNSHTITGNDSVCINDTPNEDKGTTMHSQPSIIVPLADTASTLIQNIQPETNPGNTETNKGEDASTLIENIQPEANPGNAETNKGEDAATASSLIENIQPEANPGNAETSKGEDAATASILMQSIEPEANPGNAETSKGKDAANMEVICGPPRSTGAIRKSTSALGYSPSAYDEPASPNIPKIPRGRARQIYKENVRYDTKGSKQRADMNAAARAERENKERIASMTGEINSQVITGNTRIDASEGPTEDPQDDKAEKM